MKLTPGIYGGEVVHARVRPKMHKLRYRVFSVLLDVDELQKTAEELKLFSYNRFNFVSIHDSDHGEGLPLKDYLVEIASKAVPEAPVTRFKMLCYPKILGLVFNPLTVYFGLDEHDQPCVMIYEVSNTFGQRQTYVIPSEGLSGDKIEQECDKRFYVSPFNDVEGKYKFNILQNERELTVGVALKTDDRALLRAHFRGEHKFMTDSALLKSVLSFGWVSVKAVAAIHWEALKLFAKGLRLRPQPATPKHHIKIVEHDEAKTIQDIKDAAE